MFSTSTSSTEENSVSGIKNQLMSNTVLAPPKRAALGGLSLNSGGVKTSSVNSSSSCLDVEYCSASSLIHQSIIPTSSTSFINSELFGSNTSLLSLKKLQSVGQRVAASVLSSSHLHLENDDDDDYKEEEEVVCLGIDVDEVDSVTRADFLARFLALALSRIKSSSFGTEAIKDEIVFDLLTDSNSSLVARIRASALVRLTIFFYLSKNLILKKFRVCSYFLSKKSPAEEWNTRLFHVKLLLMLTKLDL